MKKLYRSNSNKIFTGLLGGIGEYFSLDPVIVRLLFVVALIFSRILPMVVVYLIGLAIVPKMPDSEMIRDAEIVE